MGGMKVDGRLKCSKYVYSVAWLCLTFFVTPWTTAHQTPLSMGFSRQKILEWVAISSSRGTPEETPGSRLEITCVRSPTQFISDRVTEPWFPAGNSTPSLSDLPARVIDSPLLIPPAPWGVGVRGRLSRLGGRRLTDEWRVL